jgi:hypothetical protein
MSVWDLNREARFDHEALESHLGDLLMTAPQRLPEPKPQHLFALLES